MSLSSHLADKSSPIRRFLETNFSNHRAFLSVARKQLKLANTIRPTQTSSYPWPTIGTTIDYRLRYYFDITPTEELVAHKSASLIDAFGPLDDNLAQMPESSELFISMDAFLLEIDPRGRRLTGVEEDKLNRFCYVLALYEQIFRAGPEINSPLYNNKFKRAQDFLSIPDPNCITDLRNLSWQFYDNFEHLLSLQHVLNPTFEGSIGIGGADADLIIDGVLIDIKTSTKLEIDRGWLWQLMGYVLLDYSDCYNICSIGLYMARQDLLFQWSMRETLAFLFNGKPKRLEQLRGEFREIVQSLSKS